MRVEIVVPRTVLGLWPMSNTVHKRRLEAIIVRSGNVGSFVNHDPCQSLLNTLSHDSSLSMMHRKAFLHDGRTRMQVKPLDHTLEVAPAGKCKIVRIPRVFRINTIR